VQVNIRHIIGRHKYLDTLPAPLLPSSVQMTTKTPPTPARRPRGRPRKGLAPGESVKAYPRVTVRLPPETKAQLLAWAAVTKRPAWLLLAEAVTEGVRALPPADRALVERFARRTAKAE